MEHSMEDQVLEAMVERTWLNLCSYHAIAMYYVNGDWASAKEDAEDCEKLLNYAAFIIRGEQDA